MMVGKPWPLSRRRELKTLRQLISLAHRLDNSNHFLTHCRELVRIAEKLDRSNLGRVRQSFLSFLEGLAVGHADNH